MFGMIPWRFIGIIVAAAVLLYGVAKITTAVRHTIDRAEKYDETQKKLDDLETTYRSTVDRFTKAAADDAAVNAVLSDFGSRLDSQAAAFNDLVKSKPLTREVSHVDQKTGVTSTCRERDPALYRVRFNEGVTGVPAGGADPAGLFN